MRIEFDGERFVCACTFEERKILSDAGFRWNLKARKWYTPSHSVAARLRPYLTETAKKEINRILLTNVPWTGRLSYPDGLTPKDFQKDATYYSLARNHSYLGLDPGLGKTIIAALILNATHDFAVYICPPFLTRNTEYELNTWSDWSPRIARFGEDSVDYGEQDVLIVPDSVIHKPKVQDVIRDFVLGSSPEKPRLFVDEAHRFKNPLAARTKALLGYEKKVKNDSGKTVKTSIPGIVDLFDTVTYLSGTPMPNRPMETYPILSKSAPETINFMSRFEFGRRYCAGKRNEFGWDFTGASNLPELASKVIGPFMLRLKKNDVLKELPPKTEEMVIIGDDLPSHVARLDKKLLEAFSPEDLMKSVLAKKVSGGLSEEIHTSTYRKELGIAKGVASVKYIQSLLEDTDESILVFAYHKDVISTLTTSLKRHSPLVITGETPMKDRHEIVKDFQTNKDRRVFIGNYLAAGTGLTLTKATRVIFVEFSWVPADNDQASDRAHRIGQRDHVLVQYLVYKNSIDRAVLETNLRKKRVTSHV